MTEEQAAEIAASLALLVQGMDALAGKQRMQAARIKRLEQALDNR